MTADQPKDQGQETGPMTPRYAAASDVGLVRTNNEDAYLAVPPLFAVADGMGGHRAGEVASAGALRALEAQASRDGDSLVAAVEAANLAVFQEATANPDLAGMGTTVTAMHVGAGSVKIVHVGDSRAYLLRDHRLRRLTRDHTVVERLAREGKIPMEDVEHHPQRSVLERALGVSPEVDVDVQLIDVRPGDRLLLCTDGLSSMLSDDEIRTVLLAEGDPGAAADRLLAGALRAGGKDNVTAVLVDFPGGPSDGADLNATAEQPVVAVADLAGPGGTQITTGPMRPRRNPPAVTAAATPAGAPAASGSRRSVPQHSGSFPAPLAPPVRGGQPAQAPGASAPGLQHKAPAWFRRPRVLIGLLVVVILVVGGIGLGVASARSSWYVGQRSGKVAIFRGVPGSFAGVRLSWLASSTDVATAALPAYDQDRIRQGITASDRKQAEQTVENLRQQATPPTPAVTPAPPATPASPVPALTPRVTP